MQQQGDHKLVHSSNSTLYERYAAIILAFARSHTASWQDAEDLVLEVFITALEHDNISWLTDKQQLVVVACCSQQTYRRLSPLKSSTDSPFGTGGSKRLPR